MAHLCTTLYSWVNLEQLRLQWLNFPFHPPAGVARYDLFNKKRAHALCQVEMRVILKMRNFEQQQYVPMLLFLTFSF
jgi:hypothetical protein